MCVDLWPANGGAADGVTDVVADGVTDRALPRAAQSSGDILSIRIPWTVVSADDRSVGVLQLFTVLFLGGIPYSHSAKGLTLGQFVEGD